MGRSELSSFLLQMEEDTNSEFLSPPPIEQPNNPGIMEQWQNSKLPWRPRYLDFSHRLDTGSLHHSGQSLG